MFLAIFSEEESIHLMVDWKQRERKGLRTRNNLQDTPPVTYFPQQSLIS
jgi:hypothetical protein